MYTHYLNIIINNVTLSIDRMRIVNINVLGFSYMGFSFIRYY